MPFLVCVLAIAMAGASVAQDEEQQDEISNAKPDAGGVVLEPSSGKIAKGDTITITFPVSMVAAGLIDVGDQPSPFVSEPKLDGTFLWKSQTEGVFTVSGVVAEARHRLTLAPGLKDATGKPFVVKDWSAEFRTPKFAITTEFSERKQLAARPQIYLESTYAVRLDEAAQHIYFQARDSRERFPVEVIHTGEGKAADSLEATGFRVTPRAPLPVGHTFDLIVNGLLDAKSRRPLPYLQVMPAGKTQPLEVQWLGAFNHPLEDPTIRIKFDDSIDPVEATPERIRVEPAVEKMKLLASADQIAITGEFDLKQRYKVTISPELKGDRGYGLQSESRWGATFRPKESCLIFPSTQVFGRARQELRFAFFQVNTPQVTWKLARIPAEKLSAVTARVKEFEKDARDPVTGKVVIDPRTGFAKEFQTELLVDAFQLPVASSGTFKATSSDTETRRDVRCTPAEASAKAGVPSANEAFAGPYLFEASATLPDGPIVGNRSIICVNDYLLTQKRTPTKVIMRLAKMSDASSVAGVTIRAVTEDNIELARAVTEKTGIAEFPKDKVFPKTSNANAKNTHLFIADTASGPALQFAEATAFPSGLDSAPPPNRPHAEIVTDRNLYRPGHTVKMKGLARDVTVFSGLMIPFGGAVHWSINESDGSRVVGEGDTTLSAYGGWEAEWNVPEKAKLGSYAVRCSVGGRDYAGVTVINVQEFRVPLFSVMVEATTPEVGTTAHARISSAYFHGAPNAGARVHWKASWTTSPDFASDTEEPYRKRFSQLGARPTFYQLQKWGFNFPQGLDDYGAGFVLGNAETRLVDLAAAYAGLARGGTAMRAKFLASKHQPLTRIASAEATAIITDILRDNDARQKSFGLRSPLAFEERVAAKTGTSSGFRDTWTVGFDKEHTVAVWAGNFDGRPMRDTFAVRAATPLWAAIMQELLRRDHPLDPPVEDEKLVRGKICKTTGLLPSRFSAATVNELFLAGTEPRDDSADYFANDGKLILPNAYARWCASRDNTIGAHVRSDFRITSPLPNAHYQIDPVLPLSQQMVELTAACPSDVEWFVNGERVTPERDGRFFWQLAAGEWNVRAVSRGKLAEQKITVETMSN